MLFKQGIVASIVASAQPVRRKAREQNMWIAAYRERYKIATKLLSPYGVLLGRTCLRFIEGGQDPGGKILFLQGSTRR